MNLMIIINTMDSRATVILNYWFGDLDLTPKYFSEKSRLWFMGGPKVDEYIRKNFENDLNLAVQGKLEDWKKTPKSALALVVLLDQFSLNLYREQPRSYNQSQMAIPIARHIISEGWDWTYTPAEKPFVYLPF